MVDRGTEPMVVYPSILVTDSRNNKQKSPDFAHPFPVMVHCSTDRQSTAELPGQIDVEVLKIIAPLDTPVDSWCRIKFRGEMWDLAAPPKFSRFTKATEHVEFILRSRNEVAT